MDGAYDRGMTTILDDADVHARLDFDRIRDRVEQALRAHAHGALVAPPRFQVDGGKGGGLAFTVGAETETFGVLGFRVYDTFGLRSDGHAQVVAVYDNETGALRGLVVGNDLGPVRTAAINAVAAHHLAREDATRLGVLGAGHQAPFHIEAVLRTRPFSKVRIHSRTRATRDALIGRLRAAHPGRSFEAGSAEDVVRTADVLLCTTNSTVPVFDAAWLAPGTHVNTIGPKFEGAHELPIEVAEDAARLVTDSKVQIESYGRPFFLDGRPAKDRIVELGHVVAGKTPGRAHPDDVTVFVSTGLAGTEVVVADALLRSTGPRVAPSSPGS